MAVAANLIRQLGDPKRKIVDAAGELICKTTHLAFVGVAWHHEDVAAVEKFGEVGGCVDVLDGAVQIVDERRCRVAIGGDVDLVRLVLFDPQTGKDELIESDPLNRVDFGDAHFAEATDELVSTSYEDERTRHYFRDKGFEAAKEVVLADRGKKQMDEVRRLMGEMEAAEHGLLERRAKEFDVRVGRSLGMVIVVACIVLVSFFVRGLIVEPGAKQAPVSASVPPDSGPRLVVADGLKS